MQQQFPGGNAVSKDGMRSFEQAASSSFTRNGTGQPATEQRVELEVAKLRG
jgi:hypothetical protein